MNDDQLLRYSRQILLPEIGIEGQQRLAAARVLIIGLGGLGSPVAMYLAAAGVGHLELVDGDQVDLSNLQRQIVHSTADIGQNKVASARTNLARLNPEIRISTHNRVLDATALEAAVTRVDLVLDCSDNFATRFALNAACVAARTPLVSGAAIRWEGQVAVFAAHDEDPCYHCLYGSHGNDDQSCTHNGVVAPVVGIIGSVQACEAIKLLTGAGKPLRARLLVLDALNMQWRELKLRRDPGCPVCSGITR